MLMLPPWFVPGPALPWLEGFALPLAFVLAPVVVCDDVVAEDECFLCDFASAANGTAINPVATRRARVNWVFFMHGTPLS